MLKRIVVVALAIIGLSFSALAIQPAGLVSASTPQEEVCKGVGAGTGSGCTSNVSLTQVIRNAINIFSLVVGIMAVIMIIISGFKYVTSGGDSNSITSAKQTLIYAIVGVVITAFSQFIVFFVLDNVT